jgi:hypothetical protein
MTRNPTDQGIVHFHVFLEVAAVGRRTLFGSEDAAGSRRPGRIDRRASTVKDGDVFVVGLFLVEEIDAAVRDGGARERPLE